MQARPRLREPGLPSLEPGVERYRVPGGGAIVVALAPGDGLAIVDREGRQRCEVAAFAPDGREDLAALGLWARAAAHGIKGLIAGDGEEARAFAAALRQHGLALPIGRAASLFDGDSRAGEEVRLTAQRATICILHAPGGPMAADAQDPPTDLGMV